MDIAEFDDKNQHVLMPTSLITGVIGLVAEKARDHVLSKKKDAMVGAAAAVPAIETDSETDSESPNATTSKRPTIIDFMSKFKTKRSIDSKKSDCDCTGKFSIAEVIAEHTVDKNLEKNVDEIVTPEHELEEVASVSSGGLNERSKRSTDVTPPPCSSSSACSVFLPKPRQQPQSPCSSGTCDRIET